MFESIAEYVAKLSASEIATPLFTLLRKSAIDRGHPLSSFHTVLIELSPAKFPTHSFVHPHFAYRHTLLLCTTHWLHGNALTASLLWLYKAAAQKVPFIHHALDNNQHPVILVTKATRPLANSIKQALLLSTPSAGWNYSIYGFGTFSTKPGFNCFRQRFINPYVAWTILWSLDVNAKEHKNAEVKSSLHTMLVDFSFGELHLLIHAIQILRRWQSACFHGPCKASDLL